MIDHDQPVDEPKNKSLAALLVSCPDSRAFKETSLLWRSFIAESRDLPNSALAKLIEQEPVAAVLSAIFAASPYLRGLIVRDPQRLQRILTGPPHAHLDCLIADLREKMAEAPTAIEAMRLLRLFKAEVALLVALADLGGDWPVMTVTDVLTRAADAAVQSSVRFVFKTAVKRGEWIATNTDEPEIGSGYIVIAMGKYGAHELNYSSDIDLIIFYDPALATHASYRDVSTVCVRVTRELIALLSERTADGYVFRTDLRLRPDAGATQVALSTDAALNYYETVGQNWERAAFIKARIVAGDLEAGNEFLAELSPFIWRKYLDFAAIADVHAMKRQIHAHKGFGSISVAGHDIKLGRGGIREIEFFVQTQQLIAGGRQTELRAPRTLDALNKLVSQNWITTDVAASLGSAYVFLRTIEHRIQMVADEQTHRLPTDPHELARFACFAGFSDLAAFSQALVAVLETVQAHYARLFEASPALTTSATNMVFAGEADDPATVIALGALGYTQPNQVLATVRAWHHGRYRSMRSQQARERLTQVQPVLIEALSQTVDPDQALANFDRFLGDLPSGVQLFALLRTRPALLPLIADIMGSAPRLARILSRRPRLFDAVLDPQAFGELPTFADYYRIAQRGVAGASDSEAVLDAARTFGSEQAFLIGVRILAGTITAHEAGCAYAALADAVICALKDRIESDLEAAHGTWPDSGCVVIAMGKLGGREMTAASDLDIMVIYDVPLTAMTGALLSNGPRPLSAPQFYARLTQRLVSALSAPTSQGTLYEVDLRLRPSGQLGPLATSLASFVDYQNNDAWTWEHMALTRARVISGSRSLTAKVTASIAAILSKPRDPQIIAADVRDMRARIAKEKTTQDIWNLKQIRGGFVDLEFIAQYLQLTNAHLDPSVLDTNTVASLKKLTSAGMLKPADGDNLAEAGALLNTLSCQLRLLAEGPFDPSNAPRGLKQRLARAGDSPNFSGVELALKETLKTVRSAFDRLI